MIAFTYDVGTLVGQVRLYAGDIDPTGLNRTGGDRTRTDTEILFLLAQNGNDARAAAAELLETKAAEYAQAAIRSEQGQLQQDFTQRSNKCLEMARALRAHVTTPLALDAPEKPFTVRGADGTPGTMDVW